MADKTTTLRPNGAASGGGWITTGASTHFGATSDNSDASYVESPIGNMGAVQLHFTTFAFPARSQIRSVAAWIRASVVNEGDDVCSLAFRPWVDNAPHSFVSRVDLRASAGIVTHKMGGYTTAPSGRAWTQYDIDNLRWHYARSFDWDRERPRLHELYALVAYNEAPVVTPTGPADEDAVAGGNQVTGTSTPTVTFTYSDPNGDPKERHHVYVIPESVYTAAGFVAPQASVGSPPPAGTVWDERIFSSATSVKVTKPLPNGKYRAYTAAADAGSNGRYSTMPYWEWTQAVPGPPVPSLAASVDVANARLVLTATASAGTPNTEFLRWEVLDGDQWVALRTYDRVTASPGATVTAYDYEAPPNTARQYRVRAGRVIVGEDVVGDASAVQTVTQTVDSWWLKDPFNASYRMRVKCYRGRSEEMLQMVSRERQAVFPVLGAKHSVTIADVIEGETFEVTFYFQGDTELTNFERLRFQQRVLLLQNQHGRGTEAQWYVRFGEERRKATLVTQGFESNPDRRVTVECRERGRP